MGAVSDMVFLGDFRRFRAWLMAIAIAMLATQWMHSTGQININKAVYLTPNFNMLAAIIGGLLFGFGMTMAGGCGNKTLVRIGGGNLKSIVVFLVMGVFAYMTMRGLVAAYFRIPLETATAIPLAKSGLSSQGMSDILAKFLGMDDKTMRWVVTFLFAGGFLAFCFKDGEFRSSPRDMIAGLLIGLMVPAGWAITGVLGNDEFEPTALTSFTFVGPSGDSLMYLMTFTGSKINFGIAAVGGVIAGSTLMALATKSFHLEAFSDADEFVRHLIGAALMGIGGVLAMGCTIGQALTGISTLALSSLLAFLSILAGAYLGLKHLEEGSLIGALKAAFSRS
jgi:hypothetical protein